MLKQPNPKILFPFEQIFRITVLSCELMAVCSVEVGLKFLQALSRKISAKEIIVNTKA